MSAAATYQSFSLRRIAAMVLRYWYLLRYSWPRIVDLIYWPTVQMLMWGFLQLYLTTQTGMLAQIGGAFIGAVLLWAITFPEVFEPTDADHMQHAVRAEVEQRAAGRGREQHRGPDQRATHRDRTVDVFVRKLREKVDRRAKQHTFIHTRYGVGYKLEAETKA